MINLAFPREKDPQDIAWYCLHSFDLVSAVVTVSATPVGAIVSVLTGLVPTLGDIATDLQDLLVDSGQVNTQDLRLSDNTVVPSGYGILFRALKGKPGVQYSIRVQYLSGNNTLFRSGILSVTGM